jgi:hypothetical protein
MAYVDIVEVTDSSSVVPIQLRIQEDIESSWILRFC